MMRAVAALTAAVLASSPAAAEAIRVAWSGPRDRPAVALTFDDGPVPGRTDRILDSLARAGVRATFFVTGEAIERGGDEAVRLLRRMAAEGHEIGNHTHRHVSLAAMPSPVIRREVERCADLVEAATGRRPRLLRPPGGAVDVAAIRAAAGLDLEAVVLWDVDPKDWRGGDSWAILDAVATSVRPGSIVLLHDSRDETVRALPVLIEHLKGEYEIVPVGEMLR